MSRTAVILSSNCGSVSERIRVERTIPFSSIGGFPEIEQNVPGHALEVLVGTLDGAQIICYSGRAHLYQGLSAYEVSSTVRHAYHAGCSNLIIVSRAAAISGEMRPGDLMLVTDQVNMTGVSPLIGPTVLFPDDVPFVDMYNAYDAGLRELARRVASANGIALKEGVQLCALGPQYLTPAETSLYRQAGCAAVSLSMACEVIQARALGLRVLGISSISSVAGRPWRRRPADEMLDTTEVDLGALVAGVITDIDR